MGGFRYWMDPACLLCCVAYAVNRFVIKPHTHTLFFDGYFNDLLLIPCALPIVLLLQRWFGLRLGNAFPGAREILWHLVLWSVLFEWAGPWLMPRAVGDPVDVLAYALGAAMAWAWWARAADRACVKSPCA
jgi:hypothetical protein